MICEMCKEENAYTKKRQYLSNNSCIVYEAELCPACHKKEKRHAATVITSD